MPRSARLAALPLLATLGCATIFTGTTDTMRFDANVTGVRLSVDGQYLGELPLKLDMSRSFVGGRQFLARFEKEGYTTQEFPLQREFNTVAILDISSTIVSGGIDVLTGALMRFSPKEYHVRMVPAVGSKAEAERSVELFRFALFNFARLRKDIARGGGETLDTFARMAAGGDWNGAREIAEAVLSRRQMLVGQTRAPALTASLRSIVAGQPELSAYAF